MLSSNWVLVPPDAPKALVKPMKHEASKHLDEAVEESLFDYQPTQIVRGRLKFSKDWFKRIKSERPELISIMPLKQCHWIKILRVTLHQVMTPTSILAKTNASTTKETAYSNDLKK
ncbi:unnamed protein product, partial [Mesorhabditis belari]|uniref:Uncharacterized protein n=1 Tax=Mesorhabditis belari TaxID=2138241 RepID=A0AAF3FBE9_9BILA